MTYHSAHNEGFTLIEVVIALALSTLLLYIATVAFRSTSSAMASLDRVSAENALIRQGYHMAMEEADYYLPEAEPTAPYMALYNSQKSNANDLSDFRPFRSVSWEKSLGTVRTPAEQPCWEASPWGYSAQLNHPASWYRGHLMPNVSSGGMTFRTNLGIDRDTTLGRGSSVFGYALDTMSESSAADFVRVWKGFIPGTRGSSLYKAIDFATNIAPPLGSGEMPDMVNELSVMVQRPKGWEIRHILGDYAMLQNIDGLYYDDPEVGDDTDASSATYADQPWRHWRSQRIWNIYRELGPHGLYDYNLPGDMVLIMASSVQDRRWNHMPDSTRSQGEVQADTSFRRGEIPWSLAGADAAVQRKVNVVSSRPANDLTSMPSAFRTIYGNNYNRGYYAQFMPSRNAYIFSEIMGQRVRFFNSDFGGYLGYTWQTTSSPVIDDMPRAEIPKSPSGVFFPGMPTLNMQSNTYDWAQYTNSLQDALSLVDYNEDNPRLMAETSGNDFSQTGELTGYGEFVYVNPQNQYRSMRESRSRTTWHLPVQHTGQVKGTEIKGNVLPYRLGTKILRYRVNGNAHNEVSILFSDAQQPVSQEMRISLLTTSWRGARLHWGALSSAGQVQVPGLASSLNMGDQ